MLREFIRQWIGAATAAALVLLMGMPLGHAAATTPQPQSQGGLSDHAVGVMQSYAFSLIPDEQPGPDGKPVKLDKSDPLIFQIPADDARRIIRAATRSAYAEVCELPDLAQANYQALIGSERAKKSWTEPQLLMVNALFLFSVSYFAGNAKVGDPEAADGSKQGAGEQNSAVKAPNRPKCPPEQKQKVVAAINAYVKSVPQPAAAPKSQPAPAQPASPPSN